MFTLPVTQMMLIIINIMISMLSVENIHQFKSCLDGEWTIADSLP